MVRLTGNWEPTISTRSVPRHFSVALSDVLRTLGYKVSLEPLNKVASHFQSSPMTAAAVRITDENERLLSIT